MRMVSAAVLLISMLSGLVYSQSMALPEDLRAKILKGVLSDPGLEVSEVKTGIVKIKSKLSGAERYFDISDHQQTSHNSNRAADLTIDLSTVDTSKNYLFSWWKDIPIIGEEMFPLRIIDTNHDGKKEVFGYYLNVGHTDIPAQTRTYQHEGNGNFTRVIEYDDSLWIKNIGDLENDGIVDIAAMHDSLIVLDTVFNDIIRRIRIYSGKNSASYASDFKSEVGKYARMVYFKDIDGDNKQELFYHYDDPVEDTVDNDDNVTALAMFRYDTVRHQFTKTFKENPNDFVTGFYQFGDYDNDGKLNAQTGGIHGKFFMFEYQGKFGEKDSFTLQTVAQMPTYNLYYQATTNDVDNNGKKEIWIGGAGSFNGTSGTQFFIFEAVDNDSYEQVFRIDLIGIFSLWGETITSADIDNDGKHEVIFSAGGWIIIFKYQADFGTYTAHYVKRVFAPDGKRTTMNTTLDDIDGDGYPELFVCMGKIVGNNPYRFTETAIYKYNQPLSVSEGKDRLTEYRINQNHPNPFNPSTTISFSIPKSTNVKIMVYDLLGKEIATLIDQNVSSGEHSVVWNGKNSSGAEASGGIYFVRLTTNDFQRTIKILLQK